MRRELLGTAEDRLLAACEGGAALWAVVHLLHQERLRVDIGRRVLLADHVPGDSIENDVLAHVARIGGARGDVAWTSRGMRASSCTEPVLFGHLARRERILIAGAGGGFDIDAGLPLAHALWRETYARGGVIVAACNDSDGRREDMCAGSTPVAAIASPRSPRRRGRIGSVRRSRDAW